MNKLCVLPKFSGQMGLAGFKLLGNSKANQADRQLYHHLQCDAFWKKVRQIPGIERVHIQSEFTNRQTTTNVVTYRLEINPPRAQSPQTQAKDTAAVTSASEGVLSIHTRDRETGALCSSNTQDVDRHLFALLQSELASLAVSDHAWQLPSRFPEEGIPVINNSREFFYYPRM